MTFADKNVGAVSTTILGMDPAPAGGDHEAKWVVLIRDQAAANNGGASGPQPTPESSFVVKMDFNLSQEQYGRTDLDNLAKAVLDVLFFNQQIVSSGRELPNGSAWPTGILFDSIADSRVCDLHVKKTSNDRAKGVSVSVNWADFPFGD